jgi:N4-gp56 family major capsid protein
MPESNFTITQGTMTINEFGNSVPFTSKLDALSEHPVTEIINKVLKNDAIKAFDNEVHAQFDRTQLVYVATNSTAAAYELTTNGTATQTNSAALNTVHVGNISDIMKERNISPYAGDDYYAIAHPTTFATLKTNLESIHQYTQPGFQLIMNGEMGRYRNVRFVEQTNIAKETWGTNSLSNWAFFFGGIRRAA